MIATGSVTLRGLAALNMAALAVPMSAAPAQADLDAAAPASRIIHPDHDAIVARIKPLQEIYDLPVATLKQRAAAGDLRAIYALSLAYQSGLGVKQSFAEAQRLEGLILQLGQAAADRGDGYAMLRIAQIRWLKEGWSDDRVYAAYLAAAEAGDPEAAESVANALYWGRGVLKDKTEALQWYYRGAVGGDCDSINMVGLMLSDTRQGAPDVVEAVRWYRIGADKDGCNQGQWFLGLLFSEGRGNLARDYAEALHWYIDLYKSGDARGALYAGFFYEKGLGIPVNKAEALRWFKLGGATSIDAARKKLADIGEKEPE